MFEVVMTLIVAVIFFGTVGLGVTWLVCEAIKKDGKNALADLISKTNTRNDLYECYGCKRLFRKYQWDLVKSKTGKSSCPHCECSQVGSEWSWGTDFNNATRLKNPDKWMDLQLDCPKLNLFNYLYLYRNTKAFDRLRKHEEMSKRFEEYNKRDVSNWIERLQNKDK